MIRQALLALGIAGCAGAPPAPEKPHTIHDTMHCFVIETVAGNGLVCTDRSKTCITIMRSTEGTDGVTGISVCRKATVAVDLKD